jgi:hypothetical protein
MLRGFSRKVRAATDETDIRLGSLIAQDPIGAGPAPSRTFNIRQPQPIRFNTTRGSARVLDGSRSPVGGRLGPTAISSRSTEGEQQSDCAPTAGDHGDAQAPPSAGLPPVRGVVDRPFAAAEPGKADRHEDQGEDVLVALAGPEDEEPVFRRLVSRATAMVPTTPRRPEEWRTRESAARPTRVR